MVELGKESRVKKFLKKRERGVFFFLTRNPVQDLSQRGGDGQVEGAILMPCSIHGMLNHMACGIDASFVQLSTSGDEMVMG